MCKSRKLEIGYSIAPSAKGEHCQVTSATNKSTLNQNKRRKGPIPDSFFPLVVVK